MPNVIAFRARPPRQTAQQRLGALLDIFARHRRGPDDVWWLKENAEILNILDCTGLGHSSAAPDVIAQHGAIYAMLDQRLAAFPQYYRFMLSIALDLEALGMPGDKAAAMVAFAHRQGLARAELSDLQRAEARRLMQRRGHDPMAQDPGLDDRLRAFIARSTTFALPNKKAGYELTHIVFYLSEYGRHAPDLPQEAIQSLRFAGTLAYLDRNGDLLAEICVALRQAGHLPPALWEDWIADWLRGFSLHAVQGLGATPDLDDDYHAYLVGNWAMTAAGRPSFAADVPAGRVIFAPPPAPPGLSALRELSLQLIDLRGARSADWDRMRGPVMTRLSGPAQAVLAAAEAAVPDFPALFAGFARAAQPESRPGLAS